MGILRITVEDTVRLEARSARVHVSVRGSSAVVARAAVRRAAEIRDLLAALAARGVSDDAVEVLGVQLATSGGKLLASQQVSFELVVAATPDQLPDVLGVLAAQAGATVGELEWVYDGFEASIEATAEAMRRARRKADAVATAAGQQVTGIANASDSWSMPSPKVELRSGAAMLSARAMTAPPVDLGVDLRATTELSVHLSVDFEITPVEPGVR